jgi:hypothetical protein
MYYASLRPLLDLADVSAAERGGALTLDECARLHERVIE